MTIPALKEIVARSSKETALSASQFVWFKYKKSEALVIENRRGTKVTIKSGDLYGMRVRTDTKTPQLIVNGLPAPISISPEIAERLDKDGKQVKDL